MLLNLSYHKKLIKLRSMKRYLIVLITIVSFCLLSCSKKEAKQELNEAEKEINKETGIEIDNTGLEEDSLYEDSADIADDDIIDGGSEVIHEE